MKNLKRKYSKKNRNKRVYRKFTKQAKNPFCADYRHYVMVGIVFLSILCSVFVFPFCFQRLLRAFKDVWTSIKFYFNTLFLLDSTKVVKATVLDIPIDFGETIFPFDLETFKVGMSRFFPLFFNANTLSKFGTKMFEKTYLLLLVLTVVLPLILSIYILVDLYVYDEKKVYKDSKAVIKFKKFRLRVLIRLRNWLEDFKIFIRLNKKYTRILIFIWLYNLNFITIIVEFIACYFYYFSSFDFSSIYTQAVKLFLDLSVFVIYVPKPIRWLVYLKIILRWRESVGNDVLEHRESMNKGYVNSLPVAVLFVNSMGGGKDLTQTSMILSNQVLFRNKALELLMNNYFRYPNFPFYEFERQLVKGIKNGNVRSLAGCARFVEEKKKKFLKNPISKNLFGYNNYSIDYDNGLIITDIFEMLTNYAKEYLIYTTECMIIANLSIRTDNRENKVEGLLPIYDMGFFGQPSVMKNGENKFCHILDMDALRMGVKVIAENDLAYAFEFGVVGISEVGKERGNQISNKRFDVKDRNSNPLNDKFGLKLKMIRHGATVENFCFVRVFMNEQRQSSLSADIAELALVNVIDEVGEFEIVKPLFFIEDLLWDIFSPKIKSFFIRIRSCRADTSLFLYLLRNAFSKVFNYMEKEHNKFDSRSISLMVRNGDQTEYSAKHKFFHQKQKDFKMQYSTDCFARYTEESVVRSGKGLSDFPVYGNALATTKELKLQHSFWITELLDVLEEITDSEWEFKAL